MSGPEIQIAGVWIRSNRGKMVVAVEGLTFGSQSTRSSYLYSPRSDAPTIPFSFIAFVEPERCNLLAAAVQIRMIRHRTYDGGSGRFAHGRSFIRISLQRALQSASKKLSFSLIPNVRQSYFSRWQKCRCKSLRKLRGAPYNLVNIFSNWPVPPLTSK